MKKMLFIVLTIGCLASSIVAGANAATVFYDDFEDQNHDGWYITGSGSTGVTFINESYMAYASNSQSGSLSLSREFDYEQNSLLSFDIQALASTGSTNDGSTTHAASGFTISLENSFNISLGEVTFAYATSSTLLPSNAYTIGNTIDTFEAPMSDWADLALVDPMSTIANIELEFWTIGRHADLPRGRAAIATIYFDNVEISAVPIPGALWLFGSGIIGIVAIRRKSKAFQTKA